MASIALCMCPLAYANDGIGDIVIPGEYRDSNIEDQYPERAPILSYDERFNMELSLGFLTPKEQEHIAELLAEKHRTPQLIGIHRDGSAFQNSNLMQMIHWDLIETGWAGTVTVNSPGATGVRLLLQIETYSPVELIFFEFGPGGETFVIDSSRIQPLYTDRREAQQRTASITEELWTPTAVGSVIGLEVRVLDERARDQVSITIAKLAHRFLPTSPGSPTKPKKGLFRSFRDNFSLDTSACENQYTACHTSSFSASAADATALLYYEKRGASTVCNGTLISDTAPGTQHYIITAAHCINSNSIAATLEVDWLYQRTTCDSSTIDARRSKTAGGANLIATWPSYDISLLNLKSAPPSGAFYAGVNTSASTYASGSLLDNLQHNGVRAKSYVKGLSKGQRTNDRSLILTLQTGFFTAGSSGSGWFKGSDLVAVHWGHPAEQTISCSMDFGAFPLSLIYSDLKNYITTDTASTPKVWLHRTIYLSNSEVGTINVGVNVDRVLSSALNVSYSFDSEETTASEGVDFTIPSSVTIPAHGTNTSIPIKIIEDELNERSEVIRLKLKDTDDYDLRTPSASYIVISNDDASPKAIALSLYPSYLTNHNI